MTDTLLTAPDREEALSRAYAYAVAARAGYVTSFPHPARRAPFLSLPLTLRPFDKLRDQGSDRREEPRMA